MLYFNLTMTAMPQIKSACSASTDKYRLHMSGSRKNLEITTLEGCSVDMIVGGKTYPVPPKSVIVIMPGMECDLVSHGPGTVYDDIHVTALLYCLCGNLGNLLAVRHVYLITRNLSKSLELFYCICYICLVDIPDYQATCRFLQCHTAHDASDT